ncbi:MAG TPA: tetratricopeptide repeat protein, partial [Rhodocyclaceae bacterium]|nr:tetratricopeptide repeat protein [Rhodocyclaceae bacterium]
ILPSPGADLRSEAGQLRQTGDLEGALALLGEASQQAPGDEAIRLDAAEILIELGRGAEAAPLLALEYTKQADRAHALRTRLALAAKAVDTVEYESRLAINPDDHAARLDLAKALAGGGRYREALEAAMEVVRRDRFFDDGAARKAMLQIFEALAGDELHENLVREFRRALSAALN